MALKPYIKVLSGTDVIASVFYTFKNVNVECHNKKGPSRRKILRNRLKIFTGGDDGARTRDLRRDRPAF